jgi:hypothetical protein
MAQPTRRSVCRINSIESDRLVCKDPFGKTHSYRSQEIAALIVPGDDDLKVKLVLGFNAAAGLAAWGTYVLAPTCLPCAIATGVVAGFFFLAAGAILIGDDQPESLIYLAPNQQIQYSNGRTIRLKNL